MGGVPPPAKTLLIPPSTPHQIFISSPKSIQPNKKIKTSFLVVVIPPVPLVLISYSFETQIMPILILINVQYSQNAVFNFENFLNCQNHFSSGSHQYHLVKKSPLQYSLLFDTKSGKLLNL